MKIHRITGPPTPELAAKLVEFEKEFRYPLGAADSFSISHGADYSLFFRSIGAARIYLAEVRGEIVGALAVVERKIALSDGSIVRAAYFCDAKVVSRKRCGTVLGRLAIAASAETISLGYDAAFSVVMNGSIPANQYTGRIGIPLFREIGKLAILRFDTAAAFQHFPEISLPKSFHCPIAGNGSLASEITPQEILVEGAKGILTDTRRGKKLWKSDGTEMVSAHLIDLQFDSTRSLSELVSVATKKAAESKFPGLFLALPLSVTPEISGNFTLAEATVYGTGLPKGDWMINTSEI